MAVNTDAIAQLQEQYDLLYSQVDDVLSGVAGLSEAAQRDFFADLKASHTTLINAISNKLKGNDAAWTHILQVAKATQESLVQATRDITKLSDNINIVTNAVNTVAQAALILG